MNIVTPRLILKPFTLEDFKIFVSEMLTDPEVIKYYYSYQADYKEDELYRKAKADFRDHFQVSQENSHYNIFAIFETNNNHEPINNMVGWVGLINTEYSDKFGGPELQYMLSSKVHGKGYATEAVQYLLKDVLFKRLTKQVIAFVDIPNQPSIKVLQKCGFNKVKIVEVYGSSEMYLYSAKQS